MEQFIKRGEIDIIRKDINLTFSKGGEIFADDDVIVWKGIIP